MVVWRDIRAILARSNPTMTDRDYMSSTYRTPSAASRSASYNPAVEADATEISLGTLSRTPEGRQTTFETRLAMQKELDAARNQLKAAERQSDEYRRQAAASREEAAGYRAENIRLQDEYYSMKSRLTAALDSQQDLLKKNQELHRVIAELQGNVAVLQDDLSNKESTVAYLKDHAANVENDLSQSRHKSAATERNMETKLAELSDEVSGLRAKLSMAIAENESLRNTVDALKSELRRKEEIMLRTEASLAAAERDHLRTQDDLRTALGRLAAAQQVEGDLRDQISQKTNHIEGLRNTLVSLQEQLNSKETANARLQLDLAGKLEEITLLSHKLERHDKKYSEKLAVAKEKERILANDLKSLHNYVGKRELEAMELAEKLEERDLTLAEMSPLLASTRRTNKLLQLRQEREEAERLEALARIRAKQSLKY